MKKVDESALTASNTNPFSKPGIGGRKPTKQELQSQFKNIIVTRMRNFYQPVSKTVAPLDQPINYEDTIKRKLLYAGINPEEFMRGDKRKLPKDDNALDTIDKFTPVYDPDYLSRLQNAAEFDPTVKKAARVKAWYVLSRGKGIKQRMEMQTTREFETRAEYDSYFDKLFPDKDARQATFDYVDNVCVDSNIFTNLSEIYELAIYFGRAASIKIFMDPKAIQERGWGETKQYFDKTPILFQPLSPMLMGNVTVDERTWLPTYLWYNDSIFGKDKNGQIIAGGWIKSDRMIYMARRDIHLMANKLRYGLSDLQPVLPLSELSRQIYSNVLGEAVSNLILPSLFLVFDSLDEDSMQAIIDNYQQGGIMGRNKDVEVEPLDFNVNLTAIIDLMKALNRMVYAALEVPYLFGGDEGEFNRSVAETVTDVWQKTTLDPERDDIQSIYDGQFTGPLVSDYMEKYYNGKYYQWNAERLKFILRFKKIDFANVFDKAQAINLLIDSGVVTTRQAQLMYDSESYPDDQQATIQQLQAMLKNNPDLQEQVLSYIGQLRNIKAMSQAGLGLGQEEEDDGQQQQDPQQKANQQIDQAVKNQKADSLEKVVNNRF